MKFLKIIFSEEDLKQIELFYLRGGFNYSKLNFSNKVLMQLLKIKMIMKKNKSADKKGMLAAYSNPVDFTNKKNISPVIEYIRTE